ncbi:hypothetical protein ISF_01065 [Cordyceps fumosorosea ARSEF 2679]|uniref:Uncharacterized protein n=1 Tax=Cordyceps fumosorosea (strain ARSEF 2679) TaxID=1081104 RepID=A0A162LQM7_CORFA|nr:hypothetical protein ISF_01065 [Cordyceps fumosorosea ARSEF 2679]OAA74164.1 hypothetical protein ISF_01065 [Cordyceps fumosorosea ARSEF 2679]
MARTRRTRQAADTAPAGVPADDDSEQQQTQQQQPSTTRGRTRTTRAAVPKQPESVEPAPAPARHTSVDSVEIGRRALETPSAARRDTTGLDLADDSIFGDLGDSFADGEVPDLEREPRSASTTRSWSTFKPRSRQSSVVGRTDGPIRPSSRGGAGAHNTSALTSSFNIGAFRRRAREPSILGARGAGTGPRSETSGRGAQSDLESDGEENFAPDAESTPLHTRRRTRASLASNAAVTSTSSNRRDVSAQASATTARTTRKRKSEVEAAEEEERVTKTTRTEESDSSDSDLSELASPHMPPSTPVRQRAMTPVNMDEINAPPASSGSEDEGGAWPDIHALAKRRRRPSFMTPLRAGANDDDDILSDISSPPSLTHSPNYSGRAGGRGRSTVPQPKPLTTADLANLLPKRRYKKTREEGDGSDEEEEEEEEVVEEVPVTRTRGGRVSRPPSRGPSASGRSSNQRATRSASKHKTYGRRWSDKENDNGEGEGDGEEESDSQFQPVADDTFGDTTEAAGPPDFQAVEELRRATKKFSEVDKWQLEYEEVRKSPSPQGAR